MICHTTSVYGCLLIADWHHRRMNQAQKDLVREKNNEIREDLKRSVARHSELKAQTLEEACARALQWRMKHAA